MQTMKKALCFLLALTMMLAVSAVAVSAAESTVGTLDPAKTEIRNVRFVSGELLVQEDKPTQLSNRYEVFALPEAGSPIAAQVMIASGAQNTAATIMIASYDTNGALQQVAINSDGEAGNPQSEVIKILPTIETGFITTDANTAKVKVMVWDSMNVMKPIAIAGAGDEFALTATSRDNTITKAELTVGSGDTQTTYQGLVNNELKTVRFYVPTATLSDWDTKTDSNNYTSADGTFAIRKPGGINNSANANLPPKYQGFAPSSYAGLVTALTPQLTTAGTVADSDTPKNFAENSVQTYTVTAANGDTAEYEVSVNSFAVQYGTNFETTKIGTKASAAAIAEKGLSDDWSNYQYASGAARWGIFDATGKTGAGFWSFSPTNSTTTYPKLKYTEYYETSDADKTLKVCETSAIEDDKLDGVAITVNSRFGYAEDSAWTIGFDTDASDAEHNRSARFKLTTRESNNKTLFYSASGMRYTQETLTSFDFKQNSFSNGLIKLRTANYGDVGFIASKNGKIQLRSHASDDWYLGYTPTQSLDASKQDGSNGGYTSLKGATAYEAQPQQWHNMAVVRRILPSGFAVNRPNGAVGFAMLQEIYIDHVCVGYGYMDNYPMNANVAAMYMSGEQNSFCFSTNYNTQVDWSLDNVIVGTPYDIAEVK